MDEVKLDKLQSKIDDLMGSIGSQKETYEEKIKSLTSEIENLKVQSTAEIERLKTVHTHSLNAANNSLTRDKLFHEYGISSSKVAEKLIDIDTTLDAEKFEASIKAKLDEYKADTEYGFLFKKKEQDKSNLPGQSTVNIDSSINPFAKATWNEPEQIRIFKEDKNLANSLMRAAGLI